MEAGYKLVSLLLVLCCSFPPGAYSKKHKKQECNKLGIDEACLYLMSGLDQLIKLQTKSAVCWECPFQDRLTLNETDSEANIVINKTLVVDTAYETMLNIVNSTNGTICKGAIINTTHNSYHFKEHGEYWLVVSINDDKEISCNLIPVLESWDTFLPILIAFVIYLFLALVYILAKFLYRRQYLYRFCCCLWSEHLVQTNLGPPTSINPVTNSNDNPDQKPRRLKSLDTFRGISLILMIFVNYGGGKYWFFHHSRWNGITVADLVFPWFVFIMGTAMALSFRGLLRKSTPKGQILMKIITRTIKLFVLGLTINSLGGHNDMATFRIPGVLQRFAVTYLVVAILELTSAQPLDPHQLKWWAPVRDIIYCWLGWLFNLAIVVLYLVLTLAVDIPDRPNCPSGYLGPGGLHKDREYENCTGGMAAYIDRKIFGEAHIYQHPSCKKVYDTTVPYDPEGALGTLMSIFICFLGLQAGKIILYYKTTKEVIIRWFIWALLTGTVALILTQGKLNEGWIPINKNLWSLTFVLAMSSMGFILLIFCYVTIDVYNWWSGAPFFYPGMNSIFLYVCHEVFHNVFPVQIHVVSTHAAQLAMDLWGVTFWVLVSVYMYFSNIFITV